MPHRLLTNLICIVVVGCSGSQRVSQQGSQHASEHRQISRINDAPLIARTKLDLGTPNLQFGRVSPDGRWVSWLAPHEGVMNLWIAPTATPGKARVLTHESIDRVSRYFWSPDSASLFYTQDRGGNQNFVIYSVSFAGGPARALTPEKTRAQIVAVSPVVTDRILVGLNSRDPRWQDLYSLDVKSGSLSLLLQSDGYTSFVADPNLMIRAAIKPRADGGLDIHAVDLGAVDSGRIAASPFESIPYEDVRTTSLLGYSADGQTLYWRDSRGRDTAALVAHDLRTGEKKVLGVHPHADVVAATANPTTGEIDAYEVNPLKSEWTGLTDQTRKGLERINKQLKGEIEINSRSAADDQWVLVLKASDRPSKLYLYDRKSGRVTKLGGMRDDLEGAALGDKHAVAIRSRDGLMQSAYLTLPPGSDRDGDGRPDTPLPMVLLVHGGPWERSNFYYQPTSLLLANRGYATLSTNFRGSTGFGKAYVSAADGEWGAKMQDDLVDAVEWAVSQGIAAKDKVAVYGGSYGGYAVLAAMAFTPKTFACGVDLFGASNLVTQVESDAARNEARRAEYYRRIGNPTTPTGRAFLTERSPISHADAISRPLLVVQGANDPQVKKLQSDQLVEALRSRGATVTYLVFPDEGHGFTRPENEVALMAVAEHFLAQCLGGRAEPFGESLRSSSVSVAYGAHFIGRLEEALEKSLTEKLP